MDLNQSNKEDIILRKSNDLVGAKYKSSLLENKITSIAMTRIEIDNNDDICARLYPGELKRLLNKGSADKNIYNDLKVLGKSITGHSIVIEDGMGNFTAFALIKTAEYENGVFTIKFNEEIKPHILGLQRNYTTLNLSTLSSFNKNCSFRLYEVLSKEMYKPKNEDGAVIVVYGINELKFMIGLANADEKGVQRYLATHQKNIDWDYIYDNVVVEKSYPEWRDFRKRILLPAQIELEEKSDIRFEFEGIRLGGNGYKKIEFKIYKNELSSSTKAMLKENADYIEKTSTHQYTLYEVEYRELYDEFRGHNGLTDEDINILLNTSGYDAAAVKQAIEYADSQNGVIENYMGWIVRCIKEKWYESENIVVSNGSAEVGRKVKEMYTAYNEQTQEEKESIASKLWAKTKQKEDFDLFWQNLEFVLSQQQISVESFDMLYDDNEKFDMYVKWKKGMGIII